MAPPFPNTTGGMSPPPQFITTAMKAKMEHECKMKEMEIRNRDTGGSGDAEINQNNHGNSAASRSAGMKALKLPPYLE